MSVENQKLSDEFFTDEVESFQDAEILGETKHEIISSDDEITKEMTGINALLANLPGDTDVSIIVTRLNDRQFKNQFRLPCNVDSKVEVVAWDGEAYPDSIYEYIQKKFGGGHYRFQLRYGGGFREAWKDVLADPAEPSEKEKLILAEKELHQPKVEFIQPQPQQSNDDSFDKFLLQFERLEQFKRAIAPTPQPIQSTEPLPPPVTLETIKMELINKALVKPELVEMAIMSVFGIKRQEIPEREESKGFWESVGETIANSPILQEKLASMVTGGIDLATTLVLPKPQPQQPAAPISFAPKPRNDEPAAPIVETQPQATETAQLDDFLPYIEVGEME